MSLTKIGVLALAATSSLAILASQAAAWDDLPCGATEATAHACAPGEVARNGTIPVPAPVPVVPEIAPPAPPVTPPTPLEPLPRLVTPRAPQKPRPSCKKLRDEGAGLRWLIAFGCRTKLTGPFAPKVAGEYRAKAQPPAPSTIVANLLVRVPILAQDVREPTSSINQGIDGHLATGAVSAAERGRLVPLNIPAHPWIVVNRAPNRTVDVATSWMASPHVRVTCTYDATRRHSTTRVTVDRA